MEDSVIALLSMDAKKKGLISRRVPFTAWQGLVNGSELYGENWLIAYEAANKGWLSHPGGNNYISTDAGFSFLHNAKVTFYDEHAKHPIRLRRAKRTEPLPQPAGGGTVAELMSEYT